MIRNNKYLAIGCSAIIIFGLIRRKQMRLTGNFKEDKKTLKDTEMLKKAAEIVHREPVDPEQLHKDEFMRRVSAMTMDELEMIVNFVPVELCMNRIMKELENAEQLKSSIIGLSNSL